MSAHYLLGLTGRAGSGKDSCAEALRRHGYQRIAFADALRAEVARAWHIDPRELSRRESKETPLIKLAIGMCSEWDFMDWAQRNAHDLNVPRSPRWIMQRWGTQFRRRADPDYWVRIVEHAIRSAHGTGRRHTVVTDVRNANEAALIRGLGGFIVRVHRPELAKMSSDTDAHPSETQAALIECVDVIHNDGSVDALAAEVEQVVQTLMGPDALPNLRACAAGRDE